MTTLRRMAGERHVVELTLNGKRRSGEAEPRMLLCDFLRHELQRFDHFCLGRVRSVGKTDGASNAHVRASQQPGGEWNIGQGSDFRAA